MTTTRGPVGLGLLALLVLASGCGRCGELSVWPDPVADLSDDSAANPHGPTRAWLEGDLPLSAVEGDVPRLGGSLRIRLYSEPSMLNPLHDRGRDVWTRRITIGPVYETLLERQGRALRPALASSWETLDGGKTHEFELRQDVTFHDGKPLTSADVAATLAAAKNDALPTTAVRAGLSELASWETPSSHRVILRWKRPYVYGFSQLATTLPILPAHHLRGDWKSLPLHNAPVGTGPFKFASWERGTRIELERNADYWKEPARLAKVRFRVVPDAAAANKLWEAGEFDLMTQIPPQTWRQLEAPKSANRWAQTGYHRILQPENNFGFIAWNHQRPLFSDVNVRRALAQLYPSEEIFEQVDLRLEMPTTCPYTATSTACDPDVEKARFVYDEDAAKELLDAAGWKDTDGDGVREKDGAKFEFTLLVNAGSEKLRKVGPLFQERLAKAGIRLQLEPVEWSVFLTRVRAHDFDSATLLWSFSEDDVDLSSTFHSGEHAAYNYGQYSNPKVDRVLEELQVEADVPDRLTLRRKLHKLLYEDQVYLFMSTRPALDAVSIHVHGLMPSPGWYDLHRVWLEPTDL